jgi:hypothetical protein
LATAERKGPIVVTASQGARVSNAVRRIEGNYSPDRRRPNVTPWNPGVMRAVCTTAIPSGTFASPSSGEVQIYHKTAAGAWDVSGDPVACSNDHNYDDDVAVGATCKVAWIDGEIWLIQADCPA